MLCINRFFLQVLKEWGGNDRFTCIAARKKIVKAASEYLLSLWKANIVPRRYNKKRGGGLWLEGQCASRTAKDMSYGWLMYSVFPWRLAICCLFQLPLEKGAPFIEIPEGQTHNWEVPQGGLAPFPFTGAFIFCNRAHKVYLHVPQCVALHIRPTAPFLMRANWGNYGTGS